MCDVGVVVEKLKMEPGEVLVLKFSRALTPETVQRFREWWRREYPNIKALFVDNDIEITKVMVDAQRPPPPTPPPPGPRPSLPHSPQRSTKGR
jgi:hypothetical protein